ncbi:uncharacterized protein LOC120349308 [Nilaparvata lugens]|uniref:uncharacterized protein LOC120349308 n=1 Tax=Nilaparvata lugens TaxID=108931 RepID=UPI00193DC4FD|nr:uncharacterized protein LOC120349308 [Nilaparvata lugens]
MVVNPAASGCKSGPLLRQSSSHCQYMGVIMSSCVGLLEANDIHNNGIAGFGRQPDSDSGALRDPPRTDGWLVRARPVHRKPHPFPQQPHRNEIYNGHQGGVFILGEGRSLIEHLCDSMWIVKTQKGTNLDLES